MGCKAEVRFIASKDGQHLVLQTLNEIHNHEINHEVFRNLPQQRRLDSQDKENISEMLSLKANRKMIQQRLMSQTGKVVLLKDIHNLKNAVKNVNTEVTTLQAAVDHFSKSNGAYVKLLTTEERELRGIFFQDARMRETFEAYPELLCIDATYKVNDVRMPLYILLVQNGNGQSEVVCVWLVADETEEMISEMVNLFKEQNPKWNSVKTVMSDKDFVERDVFSRLFEQADLKICLFHVLRTFRREITAEKMGVNRNQRESILAMLQKIAYSRTMDENEENRSMLYESSYTQAKTYFQNSWDCIKEQWVVGLSQSYTLGNNTNNRLESINQKIKQCVDKNSKFDSFAKDFMAFLNTHRTEINGKLCKVSAKVPVVESSESSPEYMYRNLVTPFALQLIEEQLKQREKVELTQEDGIFQTRDARYKFSVQECNCGFFSQYLLPCRHIFALLEYQHMELFDESLVPLRWTKKFYVSSITKHLPPTSQVQLGPLNPRSKPKSQQQRYRCVSLVTQSIASCAAEYTGTLFDVRLEQLRYLLRAWERGQNVTIEGTDDNDQALNENQNIPNTENRELEEPQLNEAVSVMLEPVELANDAVEAPYENQIENNVINVIVAETEPTYNTPVNASQAEIGTQSDNTISSSGIAVGHSSPTNSTENILEVNDIEEVSARDNACEIDAEENVGDIVLPPRLKKRGRPKGSELTVVGIPRKRLKLKKQKRPFHEMNEYQKAKIMLKWFVSDASVNECLGSIGLRRIKEDEVECKPEDLFLAATEVDLDCIRKYFENDAWLSVIDVVNNAKSREWTCSVCNELLETRHVGCDMCLGWLHYHCAAITCAPKTKNWFCRQCQQEC